MTKIVSYQWIPINVRYENNFKKKRVDNKKKKKKEIRNQVKYEKWICPLGGNPLWLARMLLLLHLLAGNALKSRQGSIFRHKWSVTYIIYTGCTRETRTKNKSVFNATRQRQREKKKRKKDVWMCTCVWILHTRNKIQIKWTNK